jgi:hypothetical protein
VTTFGIGALFYVPLVLTALLTVFGPILMGGGKRKRVSQAQMVRRGIKLS